MQDESLDLKKINQRFEFILQGAGLGAWDWWLESNTVHFDKRWCQMLGLDVNVVKHELATWDQLVHPDDKEKAYEDIRNHIEGRTEVYENTHRLRHADGHWVWILDRGRISEWDSKGKPIRFTGTHLDITKLKESESFSRSIQSLAKLGGWELDVKSMTPYFTDEVYHIHGVQPGTSIESVADLQFYSEKERLKIANYILECRDLKRPFSDTFEFVNRRGQFKWVKASGEPIFDANGKIYKLRGMIQDITESVVTQTENRFVLDALEIGIWKYQPKDQKLEWDDSMYRLYGMKKENFPGHYQAWESSLTPEAKEVAVKELESALRGDTEFNTTFEIQKEDGRRIHVGAIGKVFRDGQGNPIVMYGVNWDRTKELELQKAYELEQSKVLQASKLASLGEMSASIAHEINNPLAIVYGNLFMLDKLASEPERYKSKIETIKRNCERIVKIISGLRKFSRTSDKKNYDSISLKSILTESLNLTEAHAKTKFVRVDFKFEVDAPVVCVETEMEQVFVNLIHNAIDAASQSEEKWVRVELYDSGSDLVVRVLDSGTGVPAEFQHRLFEPFFTTKPVGDGTGLGLSIVRGILEYHKSKIRYANETKHTCFEVRIPKAKDSEAIL